jgi:alkylation response protein AidB-like acyl-CoA dehydrogenase
MPEGCIPPQPKTANEWVLNGSKNFITHAISGDIAVVIARTGEKGDSHGMTAFVIEKGTPGFTAGRKENKTGHARQRNSLPVF